MDLTQVAIMDLTQVAIIPDHKRIPQHFPTFLWPPVETGYWCVYILCVSITLLNIAYMCTFAVIFADSSSEGAIT